MDSQSKTKTKKIWYLLYNFIILILNNILQGVLRRKHFDKIILVNNLPSQEAFNEIDLSHVSQYNDTIESIVVSAEEQRNKELQVFS